MENVNVIFREYEHIFVDSNQTNPADSPVFGFTSDVSDIVLKSGTSTFFHVPVFSGLSGEGVPLSATTLVNDGAIAGLQPSKSDRIYQMQAGYPDEHYWGDSVPSALQRGTFLCSWLSGDPVSSNSSPVWIDRWYVPSGIEPVDTEAEFKIDDVRVYDLPSRMVLTTGVYHKYQRLGSEDNERIVQNIGVGDSLRLWIDDWSPSGVIDSSVYGNTGDFVNPGKNSFNSVGVNLSERQEDFGVSFDGKTQAVLVNRDSSFVPTTGDFSLVSWIQSDDWANETGDGILDMGFRGGIKIGLANYPKTPISVFVDSSYSDIGSPTNGNLVWINNAGEMVAAKSLSSDVCRISDVVIDTDLMTWVSDNPIVDGVEKHYIYALDYNGNRNAVLEVGSSIEISHLDLGENQLLYAYNDEEAYKIDRHSFGIVPASSIEYHGYYVSIDGEEFISDSSGGWIDNSGIPVSVSALHIEGDDPIVSIRCNVDDSVWVLRTESIEVYVSDFDGYLKNFEFKLEAGKVPRGFEFISRRVGGEMIEDVYVAYADTSTVSVYTKQGIKKSDIATFLYLVSPSISKFSSYDWWRRFGPKNCVYARVCLWSGSGNPFTSTQHRYILTCDLSHLGNGDWHQVALVRSGTSLKLLVDAILRDECTLTEGNDVVYPFRSPLVVGASCGRAKELGGESPIRGVFFGGSVDDVRMYFRAITYEDLYYIYTSKFNYQDMTWGISSVNKYYLERVQRFFKFKMPGSKSAHYNIRVSGVEWTEETKAVLEDLIKKSLEKLTPVFTINNRVIWD